MGLFAAAKLAKAGFSPIVHEAHSQIGVPEHCTGLVSNNIDQLAEPEVVLHYINGARFFFKKNETLLEKKKVAKVIDRVEFEKQLFDDARSSGAKVKLTSKVSYRDFSGQIIASDGAFGSTRTDFNQKLKFLPAIQFDLKEKPNYNFVELHFVDWNPDYFIWVVPRGNYVRVGTASKNLLPLKAFIRKRFGRFNPAKKYAGLVVTSGPVKQTYFKEPNREVFLVGDSAGQVKPTTGGGLVTGLTCVDILSKQISNGTPQNYDRAWREKLGREFQMQKLAAWMMNRNPNGFINLLRKARVKLETKGDMDFQIRGLMRFLPYLPSFLLGAVFSRR